MSDPSRLLSIASTTKPKRGNWLSELKTSHPELHEEIIYLVDCHIGGHEEVAHLSVPDIYNIIEAELNQVGAKMISSSHFREFYRRSVDAKKQTH